MHFDPVNATAGAAFHSTLIMHDRNAHAIEISKQFELKSSTVRMCVCVCVRKEMIIHVDTRTYM